jgi:hypothetical protein
MLIVGAMMMYFPKYVKKSGPVFLIIVVITMIMFIIGLSLAPIEDTDGLTGLSFDNLENNLYADYDDGITFGVMISTFFPCFACIFSGSHKATEL